MIKIAPSLLSADFSRMGEGLDKVAKAGADMIHLDVMDGSFVPNITFGPGMVKALRRYSALPFDVHLMVDRPSEWIEPFIKAGADIVTFHVEAERHIQRQLARIHELGAKSGLVLNPATPLESCLCSLPYCDMVLLMSVNPGFGGQKFIPEVLEKISLLRRYAKERGLELDIEVDGGVNAETAALCREAGANVLVAGNAVFSAKDMAKAIAELRG
ncbi:MAG TPA: ribulose-phosphate 3-epimerase [Eubacteriales bacterium]|nr:ribulose-phosphate 3-epimerase [Clostridia bacterium]HRV73169.1 ribulose-phosphate 3-epimerase [Eubacteriales bacterium]